MTKSKAMSSTVEQTGSDFSPDLLLKAQALTWKSLDTFQKQVRPGMRESTAKKLLENILAEAGCTKRWHKTNLRFGKNTLMSFSDNSSDDPILQEDDLFFADIGPVFFGHEGDCGDTWVVGNDPLKIKCAKDAKEIFTEVAGYFRTEKVSGEGLYTYAEECTTKRGWVLCTRKAPGHRVCDFPHAVHQKGKLADYTSTPTTGLWILEIQIAHPDNLYGAFYEDLLI